MLPSELTDRPQWVLWKAHPRPDGKVTKVPINPHTGGPASVTDSSTWASYDACTRLASRASGIGFVFTRDDPWFFLDLDSTSDPDQLALQREIAIEFGDTYAERSWSGNGLHIIGRGSVPKGRRKDSIEIYSDARYAVMTGDVFRQAPIVDCQARLTALYERLFLAKIETDAHMIVGTGAGPSDEALLETARGASNGDKFVRLWGGDWESLYPSQSQADFALIDILAYYTDDRVQVARLFRASALGQRAKAKRTDYVMGMIDAAFDRKPIPIDFSQLVRPIIAAPKVEPAPAVESHFSRFERLAKPLDAAVGTQVSFPPGLLGELADYVLRASPRPIPQIALATAVGILAGIVGRCYNVSGTGLNQYIIVLGISGIGKDGISEGVGRVSRLLGDMLPQSRSFFGPGEIQSANALIKCLSRAPSFVSYTGEVGQILRQMTIGVGQAVSLKRLVLMLYSLSGAKKMLGEMVYSDREKNVASIKSPAFTWIGETTPETFTSAITEESFKDGMVPRMLLIEAPTRRPKVNAQHSSAAMRPETLNRLAEVTAHSLTNNSQDRVVDVAFDERGNAVLGIHGDFAEYCDRSHAAARQDVVREAWNRAWLKAAKLAAVAAVGENYIAPTITEELAWWAISIVMQDLRAVLGRFDNGEMVLTGIEAQQLTTIDQAFDQFLEDPSLLERYGAVDKPKWSRMRECGIVPHSYLVRKHVSVACFYRDRLGSTAAIKRTVSCLIEGGSWREVPLHQMQAEFGFGIKGYVKCK